MSCDCGEHGQCDRSRGCVCDSGWGGIDCSVGKLLGTKLERQLLLLLQLAKLDSP